MVYCLNKITFIREEAKLTLAGFHVGPLPWSNGIWRCWFLLREENRRTWRITLGARRESTINKLNPHTPGRNRTRATMVKGERSNHCAIHAPQNAENAAFLQSGHTQRHENCSRQNLFLVPNTINCLNVMKSSDFKPRIRITTVPTSFVV